MEYLPSKSLAAMLAEKGTFGPREAAEVGRQVADGLAAAHAAGVVHRDVKPGNVLIAEDGRVKLTDFGVSRAVDDVQLTRTGLIAGTPAFLSPEVARGREPTAASDIFALGATLYAAVEGRPPFGLDDNAYALLHKVATGNPEPPQHAGALTALLMRLLADDPQDRPTASQARDTLATVAEGRAQPGDASTGTAVLDPGAIPGSAAERTAVAYRDARPNADDRRGSPVATAADVPPVRGGPRPPADPDGGGFGSAHGRRRALLVGLLAVLVVGVGILAVVLTSGGGRGTAVDPASTPATAPAAPAASATPTAAPTSAAATTTAAPSSTTAAPTTTTRTTTSTSDATATGDPVAFVQNYYGLLPGNTAAAFDALSPTAQAQSGGRSGFDRFYGGMRAVSLENARAAGNGTVVGTVVFVPTNGTPTREAYRFVVGTSGGRQVIESFSRG
jgi:hypothetical protein